MNQVKQLADMREIIKEFRYIPSDKTVSKCPIIRSSVAGSIFHVIQGTFRTVTNRDIVNEFRKPLEEWLLHTPVFDIPVITFKYRGDSICIRSAVVNVGIFERVRPVELVVPREMGPEVARGKVTVIIVNQALAEGRPGHG